MSAPAQVPKSGCTVPATKVVRIRGTTRTREVRKKCGRPVVKQVVYLQGQVRTHDWCCRFHMHGDPQKVILADEVQGFEL